MPTFRVRKLRRVRALTAVLGVAIIAGPVWLAAPNAMGSVRVATKGLISLQVVSPRLGQVSLSWTTPVAARGFSIVRNSHVIGRVSGSTGGSYLDKGLQSNSTYSYRVFGLSSKSAVALVSTTLTIDPDGPTGSGGQGGHAGTQDNWPCTGCIVSVPQTYNPHIPTALLVALHGDEGFPSLIASAWMPITQQENVILFAPECPPDKGCHACVNGDCSNSWWYWFQSPGVYDDAWLGQQVMTIEKSYNIDRAREYITGWSGGADFLGWYALAHASRFAAANFVVGGVPYFQSCPSRKLAAYFLMGSDDFRYLSGQPSQVQEILQRCGDDTVMTVIPGGNHDSTIGALSSDGYALKILKWLMTHILSGPVPS